MASSSLPSQSSASSPNRNEKSGQSRLSSLYSAVMTPVTFVGFLFSLVLIDVRYTIIRAAGHPNANSLLPAWLHQLIYRPQPYQNVQKQGTSRKNGEKSTNGSRWFYHTKQKKLLRMEADEAFQIRNTVLLVLAVTGLTATAGFCYAVSWMYRVIIASD